jgi:TRAP-type C4-dicarboxylate transport system permease small subunit
VSALIARIDRALCLCERLFLGLANLCLAIMLVANMANIASRALFDKGIVYVFPWSIVLFVWMTFFGFFVVYRRGKDITVDFLIDRLGDRARLASRLLVDVLVVGLMLVMLAQAPHIIRSQVGTIEMVGLERYSMSLPLFVTAALIALDFTLDMIKALTGRPERAHEPVGDI